MSEKKSKTIADSEVKTKEFHERYLRAVNSPLRRKILAALNEGNATVKELEAKTGLDDIVLKWHLDFLEYGFCVEKEERRGLLVYKLTQEGKVVKYLE